MTSRDDMLERIRRGQPEPRPLPEMPAFPMAPGAPQLLEDFRAALERMGGRWAEPPADGDLNGWLAGEFAQPSVVCSAISDVTGNRPLEPALPPAALDDVDVGVVRAALGVAETGSVLLSEQQLIVEALGFLPQHLLVLLDPSRIVATLQDAYLDPCFGQARYAILMTGPSATADIEGVLIHGAQGVRSLTVMPA